MHKLWHIGFMVTQPQIFVRSLYYSRQGRAYRAAQQDKGRALFAPILASLNDRLGMITRNFAHAAILDAHHLDQAALPELWRKTQSLSGISGMPGWSTGDIATPAIGRLDARHPMPNETLPLPPASCDLILALWGLHIVNDLPGLLTQIRLCLKPDGVFLAALPGGETLRPLRTAFLEAEGAVAGGSSPHIHPCIDIRQLGGLMQRAGFALPVVDKESLPIVAQHGVELMQWLRAIGESNCLVRRRKHFLSRTTYARTCATYDAAGQAAMLDVLYMLGWAPDPSQPKPLRPGSAQISLASALGKKEQKLPS